MTEILETPLFSIFVTLAVYATTKKLAQTIKTPLFNPLLISSIVLIALLTVLKIPYAHYANSTDILTRLVGPSTVCLAIPLYRNTASLKRYVRPIISGVVVGVITHGICISILSRIFSLNFSTVMSIFPKSVTTAIAQDLALSYGGNAAITVPIVILTGIFGAAFAPTILKIIRVNHPVSKGIALGTSAHAVGTSKAIELGELEGTMAGLALIISGLLTVILAPLFMVIATLVC